MASTLSSFDRRKARVRRSFAPRPGRSSAVVGFPLVEAYLCSDHRRLLRASHSGFRFKHRCRAEGRLGRRAPDVAAAAEVGKLVAQRALKAGIKDVVFDRGGYIYHGRVKALADAAREAGLNF